MIEIKTKDMKIKLINKILPGLLVLFSLGSCSPDKNVDLIERIPLELLSVSPTGGTIDVLPGTIEVTFEFNQEVLVADLSLITVNGTAVTTVICKDKKLNLFLNTRSETVYRIAVAGGAVKTVPGELSAEEYLLSFTTAEGENPGDNQKSPEATRLMDYLKEIYGNKMLSGTMANVNWNLNEANWVNKHTGNYPAINGFDYIHFYASTPGGWIDYEDTSVVEKWWNDGGIVSIMWHWNVLANDGVDYTCTPGTQPDAEHTSFDIRKIDDEDSAEYQQMIQDLDKVAGYLKLLRDKNIPVLWRPLHEAAGNYYIEAEWGGAWFWWGVHGPDYFKKLWLLMYDRFVRVHELDNLIWIWTYESEGTYEWYPGDAYVDLAGSDIYNQPDKDKLVEQYENMNMDFDTKPAVLAECGSVAKISEQWAAGARWAYFTTWYDYDRTHDMISDEFNKTEHEHANIDWWMDVFTCDFVIRRDQLPNFK